MPRNFRTFRPTNNHGNSASHLVAFGLKSECRNATWQLVISVSDNHDLQYRIETASTLLRNYEEPPMLGKGNATLQNTSDRDPNASFRQQSGGFDRIRPDSGRIVATSGKFDPNWAMPACDLRGPFRNACGAPHRIQSTPERALPSHARYPMCEAALRPV